MANAVSPNLITDLSFFLREWDTLTGPNLPARIEMEEEFANNWDMAWKCTVVTAAVAPVAAILITAAVAASFIPLAIVGAASFLAVAGLGAVIFYRFASQQQHVVAQFKTAENYQHAYSATLVDPQAIQQALAQKGIVLNPLPYNLDKLKSLLAMHQLGEVSMALQQNKATVKLQEANHLAAQFAQNCGNRDARDVKLLRKEALKCEEQALTYKMLCAYTSACIRRPDYLGSLDNIGIRYENIYKASHPSNEVFKFWHPNGIAPITINELKASSIAQLGQRFIAGMA